VAGEPGDRPRSRLRRGLRGAAFGATIRMHRRIVGDLASAFTDDTTSTSDAPGDQQLSSHVQLRYQGACPPGMKVFNPTAG
jgi:hypothetical protein